MSCARTQAQNAVIVISPFVSVFCVSCCYPNSSERIPPTTIIDVPVTSVTQQKVIIFILLSINLFIVVVLVVC